MRGHGRDYRTYSMEENKDSLIWAPEYTAESKTTHPPYNQHPASSPLVNFLALPSPEYFSNVCPKISAVACAPFSKSIICSPPQLKDTARMALKSGQRPAPKFWGRNVHVGRKRGQSNPRPRCETCRGKRVSPFGPKIKDPLPARSTRKVGGPTRFIVVTSQFRGEEIAHNKISIEPRGEKRQGARQKLCIGIR